MTLFDVQRFCIHDGPGIRTVVFLKGCPLRCRWCQNPESLRTAPELAFYEDRCTGCMACARACPSGAARPGGRAGVDRSLCRACGTCADACPHEARRLIGRRALPEEVFGEMKADAAYFEASGGGMTLSGGEPLLQPGPAARLLALCREAGIHTAVETAGAVPWSSFEKVMEHVDLFYYDLKAGTAALHRELAGGSGDLVFDNAGRLVRSGRRVAFRMPVIPGLNDSRGSIEAAAGFLRGLGHASIRLLAYHPGGEPKIDRIGSAQPRLGLARDRAAAALEAAVRLFREMDIEAIVEGNHREPARSSDEELFPARVWSLRRAVQTAPPTLCAERALLVTQYFKDGGNRRKPVIVQKAEALGHVLRSRTVAIHDEEILVGNFSSHRVGGSIFPELHGVPVMEDLLSLEQRALNPLRISPEDRRALALEVLPFWSTRFLALRAFPLVRAMRFIAGQLSGKEYLINETGGIAHFVPDYARLLRLGTSGMAAEARGLAAKTGDREKKDFYRAVETVCRGLEQMASRYAAEARRLAAAEGDEARRRELDEIARVCDRVPRLPAETLHEAFQSILFAQIAMNLEGLDNSISPGRLDQVLIPYYRADEAAGRIDAKGARDLVGCFTVKMSEIVPVFSRRITRFHGGMFNGQVVVVGGVDRDGRDATNELTWLMLDAMDALRMRQPNYHARVHAGSPPEYLERAAAMLRDGSGAPSLMNDEAVVPMLERRGMRREDALDYSPVGCVEPVACGATFGSTDAALVNLAICLERALGTKRGGAKTAAAGECRSVDELVELFRIQVDHLLDRLVMDLKAIERANARLHPTPLSSMLLRGCLESGTDASAGGATYNASGVQGVGVADVADSLAAVEDVVFRRRLCDMAAMLAALRRDFVGHEELRGQLLRAPKYGNNDPAVDRLADRVMKIFAHSLGRHVNTRGGRYWAGFYSVTAHQAYGETTGALPSGRCAGRPLASGLSPCNGLDRLGPTASLNSVAGLDLGRNACNGINVNLKIDGTSLSGRTGVGALAGLVRGYFAQGGMQLQANVLDPQVLMDAAEHPDRHPWLLVRVSGYSAYFNDLSAEMKQEIIERTLHAR